MEVNLAPNKIKNYSYLPIGWYKIKNKFPAYRLVKMTTNRKKTYIFFLPKGGKEPGNRSISEFN